MFWRPQANGKQTESDFSITSSFNSASTLEFLQPLSKEGVTSFQPQGLYRHGWCSPVVPLAADNITRLGLRHLEDV